MKLNHWKAPFFFLIAMSTITLIPTFFTLNHFYVRGGYFWDSGLYNYYFNFSHSWPLRHNPIYDPDPSLSEPQNWFFAIHIKLIFYIATAINWVLEIPPAAYFSVSQGMWFSILGGTSWFALFYALPPVWGATRRAIGASVGAFLTSFNGGSLALIGFPHIEIAISALLTAAIYMYMKGRLKSSVAFLCLLLTIREDAGLHSGLAFLALALAQKIHPTDNLRIRSTILLAALGIFVSTAIFIIQYSFYMESNNYIAKIYTGGPISERISYSFFYQRLRIYVVDKAYVTWPIIILMSYSLVKRDAYLAVLPVSVIPWFLLHFFARSELPGHLTSYYSFPAISALAWPTISVAAARHKREDHQKMAALLQCALSVVSILLFVFWGARNHDSRPWQHLAPPPLSDIGGQEALLRKAITDARQRGTLIVDDAVASLVPEALGKHEWVLKWTADRNKDGQNLPSCPDTIIFRSPSYDEQSTRAVIGQCNHYFLIPLGSSPFFMSSRSER